MSTELNSLCGRADDLRDYAFDEIAPARRAEMEKHIAMCEDCALELDPSATQPQFLLRRLFDELD